MWLANETPNITSLLATIKAEARQWELAGAVGLVALLLAVPSTQGIALTYGLLPSWACT